MHSEFAAYYVLSIVLSQIVSSLFSVETLVGFLAVGYHGWKVYAGEFMAGRCMLASWSGGVLGVGIRGREAQ
jgi:hypothetical protein